jgi:GntR family transcriptional regulator/MocR family aminotransferase
MARSPRPFVLELELGRQPAKLPQRVSAALVCAIAQGRLADGDVVPPTRTLALHLDVARSAVVEAYEELIAAGFFVSRPGSATRVGPGAVVASKAGAFSSSIEQPATTAPADIAAIEVMYDLRPGYPDTTLINVKDWSRSWRLAATQIQAGRPSTDLANRLADHLRHHRGMPVDPKDLFIFPGVNAAIRLLSQEVMKADHTLAFEDPGYANGRQAFLAGGSSVRPVPVDDEGLLVDQLGDRDYGVYVTPAHQYPLGARLSVNRRSALLEWATTHSAVIFEDDYDGEFRYDVAPMPALRAMSMGVDRVIYLGTASKILSRDLRLAWAVVPPWLRDAVAQRLSESGEPASGIAASALATFVDSGALSRQIAHSHRTYSARRERFTRACGELLPGVRMHGVNAGLHVVLSFGADFDDQAVVEALARAGLVCAPLSAYVDVRTPNSLRGLVCGYSRLAETQAAAAVSVIRAAVERMAGELSPRSTGA